jgi:DNA replication protein DnaC
MSQQTIDKLSHLRLGGFIEALNEQAQSTHYNSLSFEERLAFLVDREFLRRDERKLTQTLKEAHLKQRCSIEDIDFEFKRGLNRSQIMELAHCDWIKRNHNLIITGPTGAGKSFLACALADRACKLQFRTFYIKCSDLLRELLLAKAGATYHKVASRFARMNLLIIDEWLRDPLSQEHARELLDLLDDRFRKASTIFISQLPIPDWHQRIVDPTLADAILDRIVHDSLRIQIDGDSMRKLTAQVNKKEPSLRSD